MQVCGEAAVWGDGIVPVPAAHLDGATQVDLDGVYHSPLGAAEVQHSSTCTPPLVVLCVQILCCILLDAKAPLCLSLGRFMVCGTAMDLLSTPQEGPTQGRFHSCMMRDCGCICRAGRGTVMKSTLKSGSIIWWSHDHRRAFRIP